ncbi:unnamed protein product [Pocillopora meandrina]|uniref:OTU domain-containing protein n=1 Tax=Pocillopora meandrina TaxID=46732 RepID=A0AAU9Y136_9CNID|nr:unnamed protein product [Pocillopora meandrina]
MSVEIIREDFMDAFTEKCKNKTVDILAFLWSTSLKTEKFIEVEKKMNSLELDLTAQHMDNLKRNLSGFNLEVDKIERDGNCFFRAVASQLNRHLREYKEHIEGHCASLGLGISEAFDTRRLRELFVKEVSDNIEEHRDWMTTGVNGLEKVYKFSQDGFFANEVGDLCARATAKVLKIPIVIVTALPSTPTVPFLPQEFLTTTPIYIAYDHSRPGYYDATKEFDENDCDKQAKETRCTCGKNKKNKYFLCLNHSCTRSCRCYNCKNTCNSNEIVKVKMSVKRGCRCGVGQKNKGDGEPNASHKSCRDSLRKSKCPCVAGGIGCTEVYRCFNCGNIVQARADPGKSPKRKKRNRATVSPYKRKKDQSS